MRTKTIWIKDEYLKQILDGSKDIEVRVGYSNIARLEPGDRLLLNARFPFVITRVAAYQSHEELLDHESADRIAPDLDREELLAALRRIYPPEKEALGVICLEIRPMPQSDGDSP